MTPPRIVRTIDHLPQRVVEQVVNTVLDAIDVNAIIQRVDFNAVIQQVDFAKVIDQVDLNEVLSKVDLNELLKNVDLNAIVSQVDLDELLQKTELGSLIAHSASSVVGEVLDAIRSITVGGDDLVNKMVNVVLRRPAASLRAGPPLLVPPAETPPPARPPDAVIQLQVADGSSGALTTDGPPPATPATTAPGPPAPVAPANGGLP